MKRRTFLATTTASSFVTVSGCLGSYDCNTTSNHLYIENQLSSRQRIDVRVLKKSDELWTDGTWTDVLIETFEIPSNTYRVVEEIYDEYGTYRTEAECQFDQIVRSEQQRSEIDDCDEQVVTIGIGEKVVSILNGIPDHLESDNGSSAGSLS